MQARLLEIGVTELSSRGSQCYFQALLKSPGPLEPNLRALEYKCMVAGFSADDENCILALAKKHLIPNRVRTNFGRKAQDLFAVLAAYGHLHASRRQHVLAASDRNGETEGKGSTHTKQLAVA